ncbi:MAG: acetyl-CoA carboxylase biotin carboxylase subunit [Rhodospirillaceae bacterium]
MSIASDRKLRRVLVANRGEIAYRAVRVCRDLGIASVTVHSQVDAGQPHVREADRSICIGPPPSRGSYLAADRLLHVAEGTGCDAVYPGYGFLSENAAFADKCEAQGIKFIGPSAEAIRMMGDKARAREMAIAYGVPVVPGSDGAFTDIAAARAASADVGYPLLLKARSGGGGRGMRVVEKAADFDRAFGQATQEAEAAFGDGAVYLERFFQSVRHIEVQVLGDGRGAAVAFDERDCSVQRRHQKLVEESPSPSVGEDLRRDLLQAARQLTEGIAYEGAGTIEFILDPASGEAFFIEMNTRIQVEHPVTEVRTRLDLVKAQFLIAAGRPLDDVLAGTPVGGHAIEFRINAEDWQNGFRPSPGRLTTWRPPGGSGVRLDTAMTEGAVVPPFYDSMIAKLIVHGHDRRDAIERAKRALDAFGCDGIETTIGFHRALLDQEDYLAGAVHTRWVDTRFMTD